MFLNRAELAAMFGKAPVTIDAFVNEGMPYKDRPLKGGTTKGEWRFDTADCIEWYAKRGKGDSASKKRADIDLRAAEAEAVMKEIKAADALKTTIGLEDVEALFDEQIGVLKSRLNAIPARLAQAVAVESDASVVLKLIKLEVDEALAEVSSVEADVPNPEPEPVTDEEALDYEGY